MKWLRRPREKWRHRNLKVVYEGEIMGCVGDQYRIAIDNNERQLTPHNTRGTSISCSSKRNENCY